MEDLIKYLASQIVSKPEEIKLRTEEKDRIYLYYLTVSPEDMPRIIGKKGKTNQSLRHLIRIRSFKEKKKAVIVLEEEPEKASGD